MVDLFQDIHFGIISFENDLWKKFLEVLTKRIQRNKFLCNETALYNGAAYEVCAHC